MSEFKKIGSVFTVDGVGLYVGRVVAGEDAIYLLASVTPMNLKWILSGEVQPLTGEDRPFQVPLSELPDGVVAERAHDRKNDEGFACVFDRKSIVEMRCTISGKLHLFDADHTAVIFSGAIKRFAMLKTLRRLGWPV